MPQLDHSSFIRLFSDKFPAPGRLLGIDVGKVRVGLALSDKTWMIASPFRVLKRPTFQAVADALTDIIETQGVEGLVVGLPLELNGQRGRAAQSVQHFVYNYLKIKDMPVVFWDERLSTQAVTRTLLDADVSRAKRTQVVDKMAASYILQGFLEYASWNI